MFAPTNTSPLRNLVNILSDAVAKVDQKYASANLEFPALDRPFHIGDPAWSLLCSPDVIPLTSVIVAAADQLIASARPPAQTILDMSQAPFISASLRLVCETSVTEILREAGPQGLHVKGITARNKQHPNKLARALRLLATHHVFVEVSPDVFANNSLSSVLDTGKSTEALFTQPKLEKFNGATGMCAVVELTTDDSMKGAAFITDALLDPATSHSEDTSASPCLRLFKTKSYYNYLYAPGNEYQGARVQAAMGSIASSEISTVATGGFPWETLSEGTMIVDVGGGHGTACREIMKENPLLKFIIQDLSGATEGAITYWNQLEPKAIQNGQVKIQAYDFFTSQPVKDADIFLLKSVLHNWPNPQVIEILKRLREAAIPGKTRMILIGRVPQYACAVDPKQMPETADIVFEGLDEKREMPVGLLPNLGKAEARNYLVDLVMLAMANGQERTLKDHIEVMEASGWKIKKVYSPVETRVSHIVAEAV